MIKCGHQGSLVKNALFWRRLTVCHWIPSQSHNHNEVFV